MRTTPIRSVFRNSAARFVFSLFILLWLAAITDGLAQNFWQQTNGPAGGTIRALAINDSGHIFAGTAVGGVFRSTNNGDNWTAVNTGLTNTSVFALAINASGHIFAGAERGGVFRSTNNGNSWEFNNDFAGTSVVEFAINRSNGHILAGTYGSGVFRSTDNGDNWTPINSGLMDLDVFALAVNARGYIFAGTGGGRVFRSTNNGNSWVAVNTDLTNTAVIALATNASGHIFAGTGRVDCPACGRGVFRSTNDGDSWTTVNSGLTDSTVFALAINPATRDGYIFAGTAVGGVFRSTNNGNTWTVVNTGLTNTRVFALAINAGGHIFAGTNGGVFRSVETTGVAPMVTMSAATNVTATSATLTGMVNPNNLSTTVKFEYGTTTSYGDTIPAMPSPASGTSAIQVNAELAELSPNTTYHYRVVAINSAGTANGLDQMFTTPLPAYPSTLSLNTTVGFPSLPNASNYKAADYRIVGLPGKSDLPVNQFLPGTQDKDWQVYWDNGAANNFFVAYDGSSTFQFSAGRAFWLINKGPVNINTTVPSVPLNAAQEVVIPLHPGWNLITNPFTSAIAWSKIQTATADTISEPIYSFNGSFPISSTFDPYVGYYFFNATNRSSLKIPYSLLFSTAAATNIDPAIWRVNISLSSGELSDKSTSFGIAPEANPGLDRLDFRKPRAIAATPTVEFKRPAWDANYSTFATDIRPHIENVESWNFDVRTIAREASQLTFSGISKIPHQFEIYLIDESRAQSVNLREDSLYHFTPAAELMKFKVVVGRKEKVQEHLSLLALPKTFTLEQNYPNPLQASALNSATTISVAVPLASEVELKVYDLLGKEVKTLYHGALAAGRYWFNWDGRNAAGSNVVTGVYLYRLNTNTGVRLFGKMILVR